MSFSLAGRTALVTGASRGIGRHYVQALQARGAAKVYAAVRDPEGAEVPAGAEVVRLDLTDAASVADAARIATDVDLLVNNAGISTYQNVVTGDPALIRLEFETHVFGTLEVVRAFAPVLAANGGGAIVTMLSALSWFNVDGANAYSAAKAAQWSLTNGIRIELAGQGTQVTGVHVGAVDTDMMAGYDGPKVRPEDVARIVLDAVEAGETEVLVDDTARSAKAGLAGAPQAPVTA